MAALATVTPSLSPAAPPPTAPAPAYNDPNYRQALAAALARVEAPGTYAARGVLHTVPAIAAPPSLVVAGISAPIPLPLAADKAKELISTVAQQAPFGKGMETVVDVDVRRAWQVDAHKVTVDPSIAGMVNGSVVSSVCASLGIDTSRVEVEAR